jgi:hypothetical protein
MPTKRCLPEPPPKAPSRRIPAVLAAAVESRRRQPRRWSSGCPRTARDNYNPAFSGNVRINGNYGDGNVLGSSPTSYLDRTAFVAPAPYTVGNLPRTGVYGLNAPFNSSIDLSVRREIAIRERIRLAIQADAFNVNNTVRFGAPGLNPDQASFGTVTTQANQPRKLQLNARITF